MDKFDDEVIRYELAIQDPSNPLTSLDIVVATPAARDFLGARVAELLKGSDVSWNVRVGGSQP